MVPKTSRSWKKKHIGLISKLSLNDFVLKRILIGLEKWIDVHKPQTPKKGLLPLLPSCLSRRPKETFCECSAACGGNMKERNISNMFPMVGITSEHYSAEEYSSFTVSHKNIRL